MKVTHTLPGRAGPRAEYGLAFLSSGRRLATAGTDGIVRIWDVPSRAVVRRLQFTEPIVAMAVSPDETLIAVQRSASGAPDTHVEVRDLASDTTLYTRTTRFQPDGLSFSGDGSVARRHRVLRRRIDADRVGRPIGQAATPTRAPAAARAFRHVAGRADDGRRH